MELGTFKDVDRRIVQKEKPPHGVGVSRLPLTADLWVRASPGTVLAGFPGDGCDDGKGAEQSAWQVTTHGSTYFLPFLCPPGVERTQRGSAGALRLRPGVRVALGLSGYLARSQLTAHISPLHAVAAGHRALRRQSM